MANPVVFFDITIGGAAAGKLSLNCLPMRLQHLVSLLLPCLIYPVPGAWCAAVPKTVELSRPVHR